MTNMILRIRSIFSSHGQIMKSALTALPVKEGDCLLIDEPEAGQDLQGIQHIREGFQAVADRGGQVIIASHHPAFWNDVHVIELGKGYIEQVRAECRRIVDA
jgi:ABC-type transport system involved in cytochrome c biogenesis ATPase subunit